MTASEGGRADGAGRERLADELRAVALLALDRLDPLLDRLHTAAPDAPSPHAPTPRGPGVGAPDPACPLCAALAVVRGERSGAARRLLEHAAGLAAALRDALAEADPAAADARPAAPAGEDAAPPAAAGRAVQHIPVERVPARPGRAPC